MSIDYVDRYLRLDERITGNESKAEQYRAQAETLDDTTDNQRYDQCRYAYEAIESGGFTRRTFADAVSRSERHIGRQVAVWAKWSGLALASRPPYREAFSVDGMRAPSHAAENERKRLSDARKVLRDPEMAAKVLNNPMTIATAVSAIENHQRANPTRVPKKPEDPFTEYMAAKGAAHKALLRMIETANDARRQGFIRPGDLREDAAEIRSIADALGDIADDRNGVTDDALHELIDQYRG